MAARCLDCWRPDDEDGVNVEKRKTWGIYPQDRGRVFKKPTICDECWARRERHAPAKPPFGPRRDDHEPTHRGERCLSCGAEGILPVGTEGTPKGGVVVYACPSCGREADDWALEGYRWDPDHDAAHEGAQCVCCGFSALTTTPTVVRGEDGPSAIYRCRACDAVLGDDDLAAWQWSNQAGRAVAR